MALRPRGGFWLVPVACAVMAVAVLPPRFPNEFYSPGYSLREMFLDIIGVSRGATFVSSNWSRFDNTVARTASRLDERIGRLLFEDTLRLLLRSPRVRRSATEPIVVAWTAPISADSAAVWLRLAERELAVYPRDPGHRGSLVALLLYGDRQDRPIPVVRARLLNSGNEPQCVVTMYIGDAAFARVSELSVGEGDARRGNFLSHCGLFARFGTPGSSQRALLPGESLSDYSNFLWHSDLMTRIAEQQVFRDHSYSARACRAGSELDCEHVTFEGFDWQWRVLRTRFIADLVQRDPEKFGAFWRSPHTTPNAIQQVYGRSAGQVSRDWVLRQQFSEARSGPGVSVREAGTAALWMLIVGIAAVAVMMRRREGKKGWSFSLSGSPQ